MSNGTLGRVYGGDPELVHIPDGQRADVGHELAKEADAIIREFGIAKAGKSLKNYYDKPICPGCYMVAGFNMLVVLAQKNGQSLTELGNTMSRAFGKLAECGELLDSNAMACIEEIEVILDPARAEDTRIANEEERYAG
jgi:hypothetical protein